MTRGAFSQERLDLQKASMARRPWMAESGPAAICDSATELRAGYAVFFEIQQASIYSLKRTQDRGWKPLLRCIVDGPRWTSMGRRLPTQGNRQPPAPLPAAR